MARFIVSFVIVFTCTICSSALAGAIELPQTGQTRCWRSYDPYDEIPCSGTMQDGYWRAGAAWPEPRFIDHGDCLTDALTGLMWPKNGNLPGQKKSWEGTFEFIETLTLCGYSDWRLPNINELESLFNADEPQTVSWLNAQGFAEVEPYWYWTSTAYAAIPTRSWVVSMDNDYTLQSVKEGGEAYVLPVRTGESVGPAALWKTGQTTAYHAGDDGDVRAGVDWKPDTRFVAGSGSADECVTDTLTGLTWTKDANLYGTVVTWQGAITFINGLNRSGLCGHNDWRLPNRKELLSLIDRSQHDPALASGYDNHFVRVQQAAAYYSSTTVLSNTENIWILHMDDGRLGTTHKLGNQYLWPVRGGQIDPPDYFILTVNKGGTGLGKVTSTPAGIDCGAYCPTQSAQFSKNSTVKLTAEPEPGSAFAGWSGGGCSGTGACTLQLTGDTSVSAAFVSCSYSLGTVSKAFTANGGSVIIKITATGPATCPAPTVAEDYDWITASPVVWSKNKGTVKITAAKTTTSFSRSAAITIGGRPFSITQLGAVCAIKKVSPASQSFGKAEGSGAFAVEVAPLDCSWATSTTTGWVHPPADTRTGSGMVAYTFDANTGRAARTGKITVALTQSTRKAVFTVRQMNK